jgi:Tfp pilus assembly protein PilN
MASLQAGNNTAVALFVDGQEVKLAKLSLKRGRVVVEELRSGSLVSKIEELKGERIAEAEAVGGEAEFGAQAALPEVAGSEDNNAILLGLLSPYPSSKYTFAYSVAEPSIYYHAIDNPANFKGKRLKTHIVEELQGTREIAPAFDAIDSFPTADGGLTAVVREDGMGLYRMMEGIKPFLGNRLPRFTLIDSADLALMSIVRANYGLNAEEITVIIYIGVEFSRLIFLKGTEFFHFAPVLGEGYESSNIQNTIYSRLLLEQDSIGIPRLDHIIIAGEGRKIGFDEFLKEQLPEIDIHYLQTPYLDTSELSEDVQDKVSEYAIPVATAWKVLQEQHPAFYRVNLIPQDVLEEQRVFKLAWHGYLLLALVPVLSFFFTLRITDQLERMRVLETDLAFKKTQAEANAVLRAEIDNLNKQLDAYRTALTVYNTIVPGYDRWSKVVEKIAREFAKINSVWITELTAREDGTMTLNGFSVYESRIPIVGKIFDNTVLQSVETTEIRERPVYRFQMKVTLPMENVKVPTPKQQQ